MHAIEKIWVAGEGAHAEGSTALKRWVNQQRKRLYDGQAARIVTDLRRMLDATARTGPGNKGKRERLADVIRYIDEHLDRLNDHQLLAEDLEVGSGAIEGAVKNVIGKRCGHAGMRWSKEHVEALLQLRCVENNGHGDAFVASVAHWLKAEGLATGTRRRLQSHLPTPLPAVDRTPPATAAHVGLTPLHPLEKAA